MTQTADTAVKHLFVEVVVNHQVLERLNYVLAVLSNVYSLHFSRVKNNYNTSNR